MLQRHSEQDAATLLTLVTTLGHMLQNFAHILEHLRACRLKQPACVSPPKEVCQAVLAEATFYRLPGKSEVYFGNINRLQPLQPCDTIPSGKNS